MMILDSEQFRSFDSLKLLNETYTTKTFPHMRFTRFEKVLKQEVLPIPLAPTNVDEQTPWVLT